MRHAGRILNRWRLYCLRKKGCRIGGGCQISKRARFGREAYLIRIGDCVRIGPGVRLLTGDASIWTLHRMGRLEDAGLYGPIQIGDNSYIGAGAVIMPGVKIGRNCIVLANSLVTSDIPNGTVAGGTPAVPLDDIDSYAQKCRGRCTIGAAGLSRKQKRKALMQEFDLDI